MPSWSPDGRTLAFHSRRKAEEKARFPTRKIWTVDVGGGDPAKITDGPADEYHAVFSPDGRSLAFVSESNGTRDIWIVDLEGENPVPLTNDPGMEEHPAWSPDGSEIVYAALAPAGGDFDLWVMNDDGSGRRRLTSASGNEVFPAWHPRGDRIAYVTDAKGNFDVHVVRVDSGASTPLVDGPDHESRPAWAPDGTRVAFARWDPRRSADDASIWIARDDGTLPSRLDLPQPATHPAWSPRGTALAFQSGGSGRWDVWLAVFPPNFLEVGRLEAARHAGSDGASDLVRLRSGDTVEGTVRLDRLALRASYGRVDLPRRTLAGIRFSALADGTVRATLTTGDTLSGFPLTERLRIDSGSKKRTIAIESIESVAFGLTRAHPISRRGFHRFSMRNGDSFTGVIRTSRLRLRIAGQSIDVPMSKSERIRIAETGESARVTTLDGEELSGALLTRRLPIEIGAGIRLDLPLAHVRSIERQESR